MDVFLKIGNYLSAAQGYFWASGLVLMPVALVWNWRRRQRHALKPRVKPGERVFIMPEDWERTKRGWISSYCPPELAKAFGSSKPTDLATSMTFSTQQATERWQPHNRRSGGAKASLRMQRSARSFSLLFSVFDIDNAIEQRGRAPNRSIVRFKQAVPKPEGINLTASTSALSEKREAASVVITNVLNGLTWACTSAWQYWTRVMLLVGKYWLGSQTVTADSHRVRSEPWALAYFLNQRKDQCL